MKNKTMKFSSGALLLAGIFTFTLTGCKKETDQERRTVPQPKTVNCAPYRSVTGYWDVCRDLIEVTNCMRETCSNTLHAGPVDLYLGYSVNSNATVTVAQQTAMMNNAVAYANANTPSGYEVEHIGFYPNNVTTVFGSVTNAQIYIKILYRKCLPGGPIGG